MADETNSIKSAVIPKVPQQSAENIAESKPLTEATKAVVSIGEAARNYPQQEMQRQIEPIKPTEPIKPYIFNEDSFKLKITTLEQSIQDKVGRPNYNPFLFEKHVGLKELINRFKLGERSKELFDSVASLPNEVPVINKDYTEPKPDVAPLPKGLRPATK